MLKINLIKTFTCVLLIKISTLSLFSNTYNFNVPDSLITMCSDTIMYIDSSIILMPIWPDGIPNNVITHSVEETISESGGTVNEYNQNRRVEPVSKPGMIIFPAAKSTEPGPAVLIFPGGRLLRVVVDQEGINIARKLVEKGITAIVVKYRTGTTLSDNEVNAIISDGRRAVSIIRSKADELNIDPDKIGVLGCSSGGVIISNLAIHGDNIPKQLYDSVDNYSCRPDFTCNLYPALNPAIFSSINSATPPAMFFHGTNDSSVPMSNSTGYLNTLLPYQEKSKLVTFSEGHGFGYYYTMTGPVSQWISLFTNWLIDIDMLNKSEYTAILDQPKSIVFDDLNNQYFVCNFGNNQVVKLDSNMVLHSFIDTGLFEPSGLLKIEDTLFVSNKDKVSVISISENKILSEITIPNSASLECVITDDENNLYINDSEKNVIFKINLATEGVTELINSEITPVVIFYNRNHNSILIGNSGDEALIQEYFIESSALVSYPNTTLIQPHGIASDDCGNIIVSSWYRNAIYIFDEYFSKPPTKYYSTKSGPAQISVNKDNLVSIPNQKYNTIDFCRLNGSCGPIPKLLKPANNSTSGTYMVSFDWEDVPGRKYFEIEISKDSLFFSDIKKYKVYSSDTTIKLSKDTDYFWRVRTVGGPGKDIFSDARHFLSGNTAIKTYNVSSDYYPNPTNGIINFCEDISTFEIYNMIGEKIMNIKLNNEHQVDISELPKGIYILNYTSKSGINKSEKVILK